MSIISVGGTRFSFAVHDPWTTPTPPPPRSVPIAYVFDLATRQWVSLAPSLCGAGGITLGSASAYSDSVAVRIKGMEHAIYVVAVEAG